MNQYTSAATSAPGDGSRTTTVANDPTDECGGRSSQESDRPSENGAIVGTLRLRGGLARRNKPRVAWSENVIDNEGCGRKSSKICCIYHKPRRFDESSSSESDSESDSDVDSCKGHSHDHDSHRSGAGEGPSGSSSQSRPAPPATKIHAQSEDDEPNAYERIPGSRKKGKRKAAP